MGGEEENGAGPKPQLYCLQMVTSLNLQRDDAIDTEKTKYVTTQ